MHDLNKPADDSIVTDFINLKNRIHRQAENLSNKFCINNKWSSEDAFSRYDILTDCENELVTIILKYKDGSK